jgi:hypothetical protein
MLTPTAPPTAQDHAKLHLLLALLERLGIAALTLAPAVAAPFVPAGTGQAVLAAATPVAQALAGALAQELAVQPHVS